MLKASARNSTDCRSVTRNFRVRPMLSVMNPGPWMFREALPHTPSAGRANAAQFSGPHHFGFVVDDLEAAQSRIEAAGGTFFFKLGDDAERSNFELKFKDPEGIIFDISKKGWLGSCSDV